MITRIQVILQALKPTISLENIIAKKRHGTKVYRVIFRKARSTDSTQCFLGIIPFEA